MQTFIVTSRAKTIVYRGYECIDLVHDVLGVLVE